MSGKKMILEVQNAIATFIVRKACIQGCASTRRVLHGTQVTYGRDFDMAMARFHRFWDTVLTSPDRYAPELLNI